MKKLLFAAYDLNIGGIEKALVTLVNKLDENGYDITLVLEKKQGVFLEELSHSIKIVEYTPNEDNNAIIRKIKNLLKRLMFILKYKNKFDFSACYATYSLPASFTARAASKNRALWGHADYLMLFNNEEKEVKHFFEKRKYNKFNHIVFVSEEGKKSFLKIFPEMSSKTIMCNNLINYKEIENLSNQYYV